MHIILHGKHVAHRQIAAAAPVLERAVIGISPENSPGLDRIIQTGLDRQGPSVGTVELEQDRSGPRLHHRNARARRGRHRRSGHRGLCVLCRGAVQVGAEPDVIGSVDPCREGAGIPAGRRRRRLEVRIALRKLEMIAPHGNAGRNGVVISSPAAHSAVIHGLILYHGDRSFRRAAQRNKAQAAVKIAEAVPGTHFVEQICPWQGAAAVKEPHPDGRIHLYRGRLGRRCTHPLGNHQEGGCKLYKFQTFPLLHLSILTSRFC